MSSIHNCTVSVCVPPYLDYSPFLPASAGAVPVWIRFTLSDAWRAIADRCVHASWVSLGGVHFWYLEPSEHIACLGPSANTSENMFKKP